jgi:hypothetical protein
MPTRMALLALVLGGGCAQADQHGKGGSCHSLSDCKPGLACIEGKCSADLSSVEGEVPEYAEPDAGVGEAPDGGGGGEAGAGG